MADYTPEAQPPAAGADMKEEPGTEYQISLDMTNPDISEQFASCEPGETLKVVSKDDTSIVLEKQTQAAPETPSDESMPDEPTDEEAPKGAIATLMAKRNKQ